LLHFVEGTPEFLIPDNFPSTDKELLGDVFNPPFRARILKVLHHAPERIGLHHVRGRALEEEPHQVLDELRLLLALALPLFGQMGLFGWA